MSTMNEYQQAADILREQEKLLQLDSFTNRDAWELGTLIVEQMYAEGKSMSVSIRKPNGSILFQFLTEGTARNNENWMRRKYNTVCHFESSSLLAAAMGHINDEVIETHGLSDTDYKFCGGGFPLRVKGAGIVAVLIVSGLPHMEDHAFLTKCLGKYLGVEAPQVACDIPAI